jgi:hypothetical protein
MAQWLRGKSEKIYSWEARRLGRGIRKSEKRKEIILISLFI